MSVLNIVSNVECLFFQVSYDNVIAPLARLEAEEFALIQASKFRGWYLALKAFIRSHFISMLDARKKKYR